MSRVVQGREFQSLRDVEDPLLARMRAALIESDKANPTLHLVAHSMRVAAVSRCIASLIGFRTEHADLIAQAAFLHDVGKLAVPAELLLKASALERAERDIVQQHSKLGQMLLDASDEGLRQMVRNVVAWHHECFDGSGYPDGLAGDAIPIEARIVAMADVYDALRSKRAYKGGLSHDQACEIIRYGDCRLTPTKFDPVIRQTFLQSDYIISMEWDCAALKEVAAQMVRDSADAA